MVKEVTMNNLEWGTGIKPEEKRDQLKLVYDYIKFHIGLYIATPAALSVIADGFDVKRFTCFISFLFLSIVLFIIAGAHAGLFMFRHVINPWQDDYLEYFRSEAFSDKRIFYHHKIYWYGLSFGLAGIVLSVCYKFFIPEVTTATPVQAVSSTDFALDKYATAIAILITSLLALGVTWKHNQYQKQAQKEEFNHQKLIEQKESHAALRLKAIDLHESFWNSEALCEARELISNESKYRTLAIALSKRTEETECNLTEEEYKLIEITDRFYSAIMRLRQLELSLATFGDDTQSEQLIRDCYGYWVAILDRPKETDGNRDALRQYLDRFWPGIAGCLPPEVTYGAYDKNTEDG
jgi:hypothetical protein